MSPARAARRGAYFVMGTVSLRHSPGPHYLNRKHCGWEGRSLATPRQRDGNGKPGERRDSTLAGPFGYLRGNLLVLLLLLGLRGLENRDAACFERLQHLVELVPHLQEIVILAEMDGLNGLPG